ncbi:MAG TPA: SCO2524 family protein [Streptosporangiaceae bacterium]|nr:SCO2524 family protein [Streptosporangiaceae bacterium]
MQIQTRRQILEIWRATVEYSFRNGEWEWGGRSGRNSISDAEQLLTILYPATVIDSLSVDRVDQTADDVLEYLRGLGNAMDIPRRLVEFVGDYMRTYSSDGTPDFSGGTYFGADGDETELMSAEQARLDVVDSFSMSITLCLATLGFLRTYKQGLRSARMLAEIQVTEELTSARLTGAMVGLLRSFVVNTFDPGEEPGQVFCRTLNQQGIANELLIRDLLDDLSEIRAGLRQELSVSNGQIGEELDNRGRMFECGWTWGVVDGAAEIAVDIDVGVQPVGVADARPYLYFTVVALDGIQDLFTERTRVLGLLTEEQQRLARLLQVRFDLTRQFWSKIATYGGVNWPLEDLPWTATDGEESDYYSILLTSIVMQGIGTERIGNVDVERVGRLLEELASRGRITRRMMKNDPALLVHRPGLILDMRGSEKVSGGPMLRWTITSYAVLLLKRMLRVAELIDDNASRMRFLDDADRIWAHVEGRKITVPGVRGLWDDPGRVFPDARLSAEDTPSWYHTERVIEVLVGAANVTLTLPLATSGLGQRAEQLLAEAEYLFDRERLRGTSDTGEKMRESFQVIGAKLRRARSLLRDRPGTASILAGDVLRELDIVDAARQDTTRMT